MQHVAGYGVLPAAAAVGAVDAATHRRLFKLKPTADR